MNEGGQNWDSDFSPVSILSFPFRSAYEYPVSHARMFRARIFRRTPESVPLKTTLGTAENLELGLITRAKVVLPTEEAGVEHRGFKICKAELTVGIGFTPYASC